MAPARTEIVEAMRMAAPCAIADIAEILDRPADTLYRHMDKLVRAGLVVEVGRRRRGRRLERLFDLVADDFAFGFRDGSGRAANRAIEECANSFLRSTTRAVRDSAAAGALVVDEEQRNLVVSYELGWLTPAGVREARTILARLKRLMDDGKSAEARVAANASLYLALGVVVPVTRRRGSARRSETSTAAATVSTSQPSSGKRPPR